MFRRPWHPWVLSILRVGTVMRKHLVSYSLAMTTVMMVALLMYGPKPGGCRPRLGAMGAVTMHIMLRSSTATTRRRSGLR